MTKVFFSHIVEYVSWVHSHAYTLGHFQRLIGLADSCSAHFINCKSYVCYSASYCALRYYMCFFLSPVWTVLLWCYPVCFHFLLLFHYFVVIYSMFNKCCRYTSRMGILHLKALIMFCFVCHFCFNSTVPNVVVFIYYWLCQIRQ